MVSPHFRLFGRNWKHFFSQNCYTIFFLLFSIVCMLKERKRKSLKLTGERTEEEDSLVSSSQEKERKKIACCSLLYSIHCGAYICTGKCDALSAKLGAHSLIYPLYLAFRWIGLVYYCTYSHRVCFDHLVVHTCDKNFVTVATKTPTHICDDYCSTTLQCPYKLQPP